MIQRVRLGDIIELAYGASLPKRSRSEGSIPVYGSNGITGWHGAALVQEPTIVVGRKGSAGAVHLVEGPSYPIDTTYFVRVKPEHQIELRFLYHLLGRLNLGRLAISTGVPGLNREDAYREQVVVPPLDEQRRIVDLLSRATSLKLLAEQAQAKARGLSPALFVEMFGDPAGNPKGWPVASLGDVIERFEGGHSPKAGEAGASPYEVLKLSAVTDGLFRSSESKPAPSGYAPSRPQIVREGDLLITRSNTAALVGAAALVDCDPLGRLLLPDLIWRICLGAESPVQAPFLWAFLQQPSVRQRISRLATGTSDTMRKLSQGRLRTLEVLCPPQELQTEFSNRFHEVRSVQRLAAAASGTADRTSRALLARLFS